MNKNYLLFLFLSGTCAYSSLPAKNPQDENNSIPINHPDENKPDHNPNIVPKPDDDSSLTPISTIEDENNSISIDHSDESSVGFNPPIISKNTTIPTSTIEDEIIKKAEKCKNHLKPGPSNCFFWSETKKRDKTLKLVNFCKTHNIDIQRLGLTFYINNHIINPSGEKINEEKSTLILFLFALYDYTKEIDEVTKSEKFIKDLEIVAEEYRAQMRKRRREEKIKNGKTMSKEEANNNIKNDSYDFTIKENNYSNEIIKKYMGKKYMGKKGVLEGIVRDTYDPIYEAKTEYKHRITLDKELSDQLDELKLKKQKELSEQLDIKKPEEQKNPLEKELEEKELNETIPKQ